MAILEEPIKDRSLLAAISMAFKSAARKRRRCQEKLESLVD